MITCRECAEFLMAYVEGTLPAGQRAVFEEHLKRCKPCVHFVESYQATVAMGKAMGTAPACEKPLPEALVKAIMGAMGRCGGGPGPGPGPKGPEGGDCGCRCG